jgi:hypothetical protein
LISTTAYAQRIAFATDDHAAQTIGAIRAAHRGVEMQRGDRIPAWAHRDVLYMLADYSERAFHGLHRPLASTEQQDMWDVFYRMGTLLEIPELPQSYAAWRLDRERHLQRDLAVSGYTRALYAAYRRQLGIWRYNLLRQVQGALAPPLVCALLGLPHHARLVDLIGLYSMFGRGRMRYAIQRLLIPPAYLPAVRALDIGNHEASRLLNGH